MQVEFDCWCGEETWHVELTHPPGGADGYLIMINKYYHGTLFKMRGEWAGYVNDKSGLTGDELMILGDIIDEA